MKTKWLLIPALWFLLFAGDLLAQHQEEHNFLMLINDYRNESPVCFLPDPSGNSHGLPTGWPPGDRALQYNVELSRSALRHNQLMDHHNCFSHFCGPETPDAFADRFNEFGHTGWRSAAENIAAGNPDAANTLRQWQTSTEGHNEAMLDCRYTQIGISRISTSATEPVSGAPYLWFWTTHFTNGDDSVTPPEPPPPSGGCWALDANNNNQIDDTEILDAIARWITGQPICT